MLQVEHSVILLTYIKLPIVVKNFVLSILEWRFYTGFTVFELTPDYCIMEANTRSVIFGRINILYFQVCLVTD